ncbi:MAG TPA: hypothetical protein VGH28_02690 [Polyangiaceae bacterium]|jgi:hypothetical protein
MHALTRSLFIVAFALVSDNALARGNGWFQFSVDGGATWVAQTPALDLGTDSGTTFNALRGASVPAGGATWFGGGGIDVRAGPKGESWFIPLFGFRFGISDFHASIANGDNVTTTLDTLIYTEMFLPGLGWRFGDHVSLALRPAYVRLDTSGTATDGHITTSVDAGSDGFALLGDVQACLGPHTTACAFVEPNVMWMAGPNFALSFGLRFALAP